MAHQDWLAFVLASIVVLVVPGPTILTLTSYSIAYGSRVSTLLVAAVALGDSTAVCASLLGVGVLLARSSFWFTFVRWVGALYLLYLGVTQIRRRTVVPSEVAVLFDGRRRLFASVFAITASNPKGLIFYFGFLPQFVNPTGDVSKQLWLMATTFVLLATVNATLYVALASSVRRVLGSTRVQRGFNVLGGSLLLAAGFWALCAYPTR